MSFYQQLKRMGITNIFLNYNVEDELKVLSEQFNAADNLLFSPYQMLNNDYVDNILNTRIKPNEKILNKTKIIPECDLRTLIDAKIMTMEEKQIKNTIHVDKQIKTTDFIEMDNNLVEDICKIVGVYLDNAIEAVENLNKKEVQLDLYNIDGYMHISVVNNYEGHIDLDKLNNVGYTTKSNGHGYGLALANEIVENNKVLSKETHIDQHIFKQVLKIKM